MSPLEVRLAIISDCAGIARVQVDSYLETYTGILPRSYLEHFTYEEQEKDWQEFLAGSTNEVLQVAVTESDEIAGYALGSPDVTRFPSYESELIALHIRGIYQRQGLGRRLMAATSEALASQGARSLYLWVLKDNPVRSFYEKLGGALVDEKPWQNNSYFKTNIREVAYGWGDIRKLLEKAE